MPVKHLEALRGSDCNTFADGPYSLDEDQYDRTAMHHAHDPYFTFGLGRSGSPISENFVRCLTHIHLSIRLTGYIIDSHTECLSSWIRASLNRLGPSSSRREHRARDRSCCLFRPTLGNRNYALSLSPAPSSPLVFLINITCLHVCFD